MPEPLRIVENSDEVTRKMHAEQDYGLMWTTLYEDIATSGLISIGAGYPVKINNYYIMSPSPIPRWDIKKLDMADCIYLFGAGREKRIYAVPPYTKVEPLQFEDKPFTEENFDGKKCSRCGSASSFLDEIYDELTNERYFVCSDTDYCDSILEGGN